MRDSKRCGECYYPLADTCGVMVCANSRCDKYLSNSEEITTDDVDYSKREFRDPNGFPQPDANYKVEIKFSEEITTDDVKKFENLTNSCQECDVELFEKGTCNNHECSLFWVKDNDPANKPLPILVAKEKVCRRCAEELVSGYCQNIACDLFVSSVPAAPIPAPTPSALDTQVDGAHYKNCVIQPIEYCQKNQLRACETFVVKYVTRHRDKNGAADIKKAIHCLQLLLQLEYGE